MTTLSLSNPWLEFTLDPALPSWSLHACEAQTPSGLSVENARLSVHYRIKPPSWGGVIRRSLGAGGPWQAGALPAQDSPHGRLQRVALSSGPDPAGLVCTLEAALPQDRPCLLLKWTLENRGEQPLFVDRLELLDAAHPQARFPWLEGDGEPVFFSNGWQSWNWTGAYGRRDRFRRTRLGYLTEPLRVNAGTPQPLASGRFGSDLFGVLGSRKSRAGILAGFLSQEAHFGSLLADLRGPHPALRLWANGDGARLDPGVKVETDWASCFPIDFDRPDPLGEYVDAVARQNEIRVREAPSGWSSWYLYYGRVTAEDVLRNLQAAGRLRDTLPLELVQLDDGFQAAVGDWFSFRPGFPRGVEPLAGAIREAGFTPGLWLAPFILDPHSRLALEHPDWLLHSSRTNRPVHAGYLFDGIWTKALDLTRPAVLEHVREVIHKAVHSWGYPYLKLDFLYAGALPGRRHDPTLTRAQALRGGLQAIRQAAGEQAFLLGCGCPLGPALGLVDGMRIGADVAEDWHPRYHGVSLVFHGEPDHPSARNTIQNALTRSTLHGRWWVNDADALLVRPDTHLNLDEVQTLSTVISLTGGPLVLSDDLSALPEDRLRLAASLFPPLDRRPQVPDLFDSPTPRRLRLDLEGATGSWSLLAAFNWEDRPRDLTLRLEEYGLAPGGACRAREFWRGQNLPVDGGALRFPQVAAHGVVLVAVRARLEGRPQYLGSSLHISQGLEVAGWEPGLDSLRLALGRPGRASGEIDLALPSTPRSARLGDQPLSWKDLGEGCWRFEVAFTGRADVVVEW